MGVLAWLDRIADVSSWKMMFFEGNVPFGYVAPVALAHVFSVPAPEFDQ
jgi:hypothetical protein